ncbi:MAG: tetratricopeptide repeat-containing diguanylate cyclase [Burkholderiales bacterium]
MSESAPSAQTSVEFDQKLQHAGRLFFAGDLPGALATARDLLTGAFGLAGGSDTTRPAEVADAATLLARIARRGEEFGDALRWADTALTAALVIADPRRECLARVQHARVLSVLGQTDEALETSYAALRAAALTQRGDCEASALEALADVQWSMAQWTDSLASYERILQLALACGSLELEAIAHGGLGGVNHHLGSVAETAGSLQAADSHFRTAAAEALEFARCARLIGDVYNVRTATHNHAIALLALGDTVSARASLERLLADNAAADSVHAITLKNLADVDYAEGRYAESVARLRTALAESERLGQPHHSMVCCESLSGSCEATGDLAAALSYQRRFHALYEQVASRAAQAHAQAMAVKFDTDTSRSLALAERERADRLESSHTSLSLEAQRLERMALEDPLTGIGNRRHFDRSLQAVEQNTDPARRCSLALLDIDFFKRVNDECSHLVGDDVLRRIGAILTANSRRGDTVSRYGGEEFAMLLTDLDPSAAAAACERVRHAIESEPWAALHPALRVTVSIGLAHRVAGLAGPRALIDLADRRLYAAKTGGRNRVVAEDLPEILV